MNTVHNNDWRQISSARLAESVLDTRARLAISVAVKDTTSHMQNTMTELLTLLGSGIKQSWPI